jgi:hypothetical protein
VVAAYALAAGDLATAEACAREALPLALEVDSRLAFLIAIQHLAGIVLARDGDAQRAARLLGFVDAHFSAAAFVRETMERLGYERDLAAIQTQLGATATAEELAVGARYTDERAVREAQRADSGGAALSGCSIERASAAGKFDRYATGANDTVSIDDMFSRKTCNFFGGWAPRRDLRDFLDSVAAPDAMPIDWLHGFLCAIACGPTHAVPLVWLPHVWGDTLPAFESPAQVEHITGLIVDLANSIEQAVSEKTFAPLLPGSVTGDITNIAQRWCAGF